MDRRGRGRKPCTQSRKPKKAHWHIVVSYKNPVTFAKAREVFDEIGASGSTGAEGEGEDFQQMARYLCHLDQPKHRYDPADVQAFGALDYQRLIMAGRDEDNLLDEMMEYIDENCITSFRQFCVYVRTEKPEWRVLVYHQYAALISRYIKSLAWEMEQANRR